VLQICELVLFRTAAFLAELALLPIPPVIPELFSPRFNLDEGLETFFGVPVAGNWWLVLFWLGWLVVNIGGEELLWRGYALPLQERVFGGNAWIVNGLCWNVLVHAFMWWNVLTLLPISLAVPYLVQRYQNTWIGIYLHGVGNLLVLAILIPSIAGWL
ncbi:MAG: CPBP family intramembrane glutamic endopeptidase, partial [Pseudomonadota bacterium]